MRSIVVSLVVVGICNGIATADTSPNFVFVIADDLGWADVSFHGGKTPTPNLDRLANSGLELTQHYVAPVCSPTRAGFLTGRCWSRFGITTPINTRGLPWNTVTLAKALKSRGYETCLIGKWHLGSKPAWGPNKFGFDHAYGSLAGGVSPWNHRYKKGEYSVTWHRNGKLVEEAGHVTDLLTAEAIDWIRSRGESPFFLYVPYTAVHLPLKEPAEWLMRVPASTADEVSRHYAASVMHLDDAVGKLLTSLEETGRLENTLFVFTSDNGASTAENNDLKYPDDDCPDGRLPGNNAPLRGQKGSIYEGGTRVPTIVSWPRRIPHGTCDTPVFVADWMPTFCTLAGFRAPKELKWDGVDLSALLFQQSKLSSRSIYIKSPRGRAKSLRYENWKLVVHDSKPNGLIELFNLDQDPSETQNVAERRIERVQQMMQRLKQAEQDDNDSVAKGGN